MELKKRSTTDGFKNAYSLNEIFKDRFFKIPDYQRGYSWEEKHLKDLKEDILHVQDKEHSHYTGTLVLTETNENDTIVFEIVDGQQRLTSLIILLLVISNTELDFKGKGEIAENFISRGFIGAKKAVLQPNNETRDAFYAMIFENNFQSIEENKSQRLINEAYAYFQKWIKNDFRSSSDIELLYKTIVTKLRFLIYLPSVDKREIGIMFEVINNRGKTLSQLEKVKNYFIYYCTIFDLNQIQEEINLKWLRILKYLSLSGKTDNEDEDAFLRNCFIVFMDPDKEKSRETYERLKEIFSSKSEPDAGKIMKLQSFIRFIEESAKHYAYFYNEHVFLEEYKGNQKNKINIALQFLRTQYSFASLMPLYLAIMNKVLKAPIKVLELLELLEKFNFRIYILPEVRKRTDSGQATLFYLSNFFYNNSDWTSDLPLKPKNTFSNNVVSNNIYSLVEDELLYEIKNNCPQEVFINALVLDDDEVFDYYKWRQGLRYFLGNYEIYLRSKDAKGDFNIQDILSKKEKEKTTATNKNDVFSIEHIWAQKSEDGYFDRDYIEKRRLGNLVLMGLKRNQEQSNAIITEKINYLNNKLNEGKVVPLLQVMELVKILNDAKKVISELFDLKNKGKGYWNKISMCINDIRETKLIDFALERWKIKGEKDITYELNSFKKDDRKNKEFNKKYLKIFS